MSKPEQERTSFGAKRLTPQREKQFQEFLKLAREQSQQPEQKSVQQSEPKSVQPQKEVNSPEIGEE